MSYVPPKSHSKKVKPLRPMRHPKWKQPFRSDDLLRKVASMNNNIYLEKIANMAGGQNHDKSDAATIGTIGLAGDYAAVHTASKFPKVFNKSWKTTALVGAAGLVGGYGAVKLNNFMHNKQASETTNPYLEKISEDKKPSKLRAAGRGYLEAVGAGITGKAIGKAIGGVAGIALTRGKRYNKIVTPNKTYVKPTPDTIRNADQGVRTGGRIGDAVGSIGGAFHGYHKSIKNQTKK